MNSTAELVAVGLISGAFSGRAALALKADKVGVAFFWLTAWVGFMALWVLARSAAR